MKPEEILAELKIAREKIEFLENELKKQKKFEFKYKKEETFIIYSGEIESKGNGDAKKKLDFGLYRISEDNAKEALQLNKEINLIGAIAEQIDVNYSKNVNFDDKKYFIYFSTINKKYDYTFHEISRALGTVYMTKEVAKRVCEILNNKEVEL